MTLSINLVHSINYDNDNDSNKYWFRNLIVQ
jgi:hypothetical protein